MTRISRRVWRGAVVGAVLVTALFGLPAGPAGAADITYNVINYNSAKCLDVSGVSLSNGADLHQWSCHLGPNQDWTFQTNGVAAPGYGALIAGHSGKCMDVEDRSMADGANVHQWTCHLGPWQQWAFGAGGAPSPGGIRYQIKNQHSGKCLEVAGGSTGQGAEVQQWTCNGSPRQLWLVTFA